MLNFMLMRTTLNLDPEVLTKVRVLARQRGVSLGTVVSELIRQALSPRKTPPIRNGVPISPAREGPPPDLDLVNPLRD
jgi:hypothetical protein